MADESTSPPQDHPYVVEMLDQGCSNGLVWTVMPYYQHGNLRQHFRHEEHRVVRQVLAVADHVLAALESEPSRVHGDIKATNIVVERLEKISRRGVPEFTDLHIRLIDWGFRGGPSGALRGGPNGTPHWRAPEHSRGEAPDTRSDLYAVGVLLYWLLSGRLLYQTELGRQFTDEAASTLRESGRRPERLDLLVPGVPKDLGVFVDRLLDPQPSRRLLDDVPADCAVTAARRRLAGLYGEVEEMVRTRLGEVVVVATVQPDDGAAQVSLASVTATVS